MKRRFKHPVRLWGPTGIRWRREAIESFRHASVEAQPGEVWTWTYDGFDHYGDRFITSEAGPVRILVGGPKGIGEEDLDQEFRPLRWWNGLLPSKGQYSLVSGDDIPGDVEIQPDAATRLDAAINGEPATVEWRRDHPVYAGVRFVAEGIVGEFRHVDGHEGRMVGDAWVRFDWVVYVDSPSLRAKAEARR